MEYRSRIANTGVRFSARPVILSPQLEDLDHSEVLKRPIASDRVGFRILLTVMGFQLNEVKITFIKENLLQVRMQQIHEKTSEGPKKVRLLARDLCYLYEIPKHVDKQTLLAQWTADDFLVIQSRSSASLTPNYKADRILPVRVGRVLKPFLDTNILKEMMIAIQKKMNELRTFIHENTIVPADKDVLELGGGYQSEELYGIQKEMVTYLKSFENKYDEIMKEEYNRAITDEELEAERPTSPSKTELSKRKKKT